MIIIDAPLVFAVSALITNISALVWWSDGSVEYLESGDRDGACHAPRQPDLVPRDRPSLRQHCSTLVQLLLGKPAIWRDSMRVKTGLDHLPEGKRCELEHVVAIIREGFARTIKHRTQLRYRTGKLLKIVLFGSYARGDWVEDPVGRYFSDYDLLVVVNHDDLTDVAEFWLKTEERLLEELTAGQQLRTPVSPIYHSLDDVNEKLRLGRYFFMDIVRDGIVLFEEPGFPFAEPHPLTHEQALQETQDYYDEWFESAGNFLALATSAHQTGMLKEAAFLLHQATERYYHCLFLVRTLYSPKTHNLNRLREQAEQLEPRLKGVWPAETKFERRCYELLRAAYVKARYSRHYRISADELAWLGERVSALQERVREICAERIEVLAKAA